MNNVLLIFILLLIVVDLRSQTKKRFYDHLGSKTDSSHSYYYELDQYGLDTLTYSYYSTSNFLRHKETKINKAGEKHVLYYYENGGLKAEGNEFGFPVGNVTMYLPNGEKKAELFFPKINPVRELDSIKILFYRDSIGNYMVKSGKGNCVCDLWPFGESNLIETGEVKNGLKDGVWQGNSKGTSYDFQELYENGKFIGGISTSNGESYEYKTFEEAAVPINGMKVFYQAIGERMVYTKKALKKRIQGRVFIQFDIDTDGSIVDAKVLRGIDEDLDRIALEAVTSAPRWKPGTQRGRPVKQRMVIPLSFKIG